MTPEHAILPIVALFVAGVALVTDLRARRIPNWLTASALLVGIVGNVCLGVFGSGLTGAASGAGVALLGALLGFALLFPMYLFRVAGVGRVIGAGDVKLLAALGALVGPQALISIAIYAAMAGGIQAVIMLMQRGRLGLFAYEALVMRVSPTPSGAKAPYALPIFIGVVASMLLPSVVRF